MSGTTFTNLLQFAISKNYREFKYCPLATVMSVFGLIPLIASIFLLFTAREEHLFSQTATENMLIAWGIFGACFALSFVVNHLAGSYASKYVLRTIRKDWEFADRYSIDNPELLEYCKEQNPEFAQKLMERIERERLQDLEVEQAAQEVRREREARRAREAAGNGM